MMRFMPQSELAETGWNRNFADINAAELTGRDKPQAIAFQHQQVGNRL
jgi:hypothetical protein